MSLSILVVDDDRTIRETLADFLVLRGHTVRSAETATAGRRAAAEHTPDIVLLDLRLPDADGTRLLEALQADDPEIGVVVLTGHADVPTAVRLMQRGAADVLEKPVDLTALDGAVQRAAELGRMRRELALLRARDSTEAWSDRMPPSAVADLDRLVHLAARNDDAPVLIEGETGTGKGWVARRIHDLSPRSRLPFVEVNCATLSATFFESELFGHERGAFTDAKQAKRGLLEVAGRGTAFLDEVGELSGDVQPRLLKVLEEGRFRRLGGTTELRTEARLVVATNRTLADLVAERHFRADLYYRLQVLTLTLPPLRERRAELPALAASLLPRGARLSDRALRALLAYDWPGNIRELKNSLWRAAILADGGEIGVEHLGLSGEAPRGDEGDPILGLAGPVSLADAERLAIRQALAHTGGNKRQAATLLGIARSTLQEKLRRLEPDPGDPAPTR